jgi:hypothetical protein
MSISPTNGSRENLERLAAALQELDATLRGVPSDVSFLLDAKTLEDGMHLTFETPSGSLEILADPSGALLTIGSLPPASPRRSKV